MPLTLVICIAKFVWWVLKVPVATHTAARPPRPPQTNRSTRKADQPPRPPARPRPRSRPKPNDKPRTTNTAWPNTQQVGEQKITVAMHSRPLGKNPDTPEQAPRPSCTFASTTAPEDAAEGIMNDCREAAEHSARERAGTEPPAPSQPP